MAYRPELRVVMPILQPLFPRMPRLLTGSLMAVLLALGCSKKVTPQPQPKKVTTSATASSSPAPSAVITPSPGSPEDLVLRWTRALNEKDLSGLSKLYAERVNFYGQWLSRDQVLKRKSEALQRTPDFEQTIVGQPQVTRSQGKVLVSFLKRSGSRTATTNVQASLRLVQTPELRIAEETDSPTQSRFTGDRAAPRTPAERCQLAVIALIESTADGQALARNIDRDIQQAPNKGELRAGGLGPMDPDSAEDDTFQYAMGVHHPERFESYAWFTVNARTGAITVSTITDQEPRTAEPDGKTALPEFLRWCGRR